MLASRWPLSISENHHYVLENCLSGTLAHPSHTTAAATATSYGIGPVLALITTWHPACTSSKILVEISRKRPKLSYDPSRSISRSCCAYIFLTESPYERASKSQSVTSRSVINACLNWCGTARDVFSVIRHSRMWCPYDIGRESWVWGEQEALCTMNSPHEVGDGALSERSSLSGRSGVSRG